MKFNVARAICPGFAACKVFAIRKVFANRKVFAIPTVLRFRFS